MMLIKKKSTYKKSTHIMGYKEVWNLFNAY